MAGLLDAPPRNGGTAQPADRAPQRDPDDAVTNGATVGVAIGFTRSRVRPVGEAASAISRSSIAGSRRISRAAPMTNINGIEG
ncbi:hypothetical protein IFU08_11410 [Microbacterium sp. CFBP 8790]|nr:hypothetical protein [Microbacterium sp. CFBP 8790]MBD8510164.1 hypothetical protein [Microbacterium sp. CFBP 8790]